MGSTSLVHQTPGDPHDPNSGEPTIMAFRRPTDRPAPAASVKAQTGKPQTGKTQNAKSPAGNDPLPVLLRLPDLSRDQSVPSGEAAPESTRRPWFGIAMWCATGGLAVVAAVLIFTGRPEPTAPADEALPWQAGSAMTANANHAPTVGDGGANSYPPFVHPVDRAAVVHPADPGSPQAADGSSDAPTGPFPWRERGTSQQPVGAVPFPNDNAPAEAYPTGGLAPSLSPGDTIPGGPGPSGLRQPAAGPGGPAGFGDPSLPEAPPPDQSKLQTGLRSATHRTPLAACGWTEGFAILT